MPGSLSHLSQRFFDVLLARPLDEIERATVETWLDTPLSAIFFAQSHPDQRHGYRAALVVLGEGVSDLVVVRAALLHDVGKRHAGLRVVGRVWASLSIRLGLPLTRRGRIYREHGEVAARELEALGAEPLVVQFARHHHDDRSPGVPDEIWNLLQRADQPPKAGQMVRARIS